MILAAHGPEKRCRSVLHGPRGPGGSTIDTYAEYLLSLPESRPVLNRDIVLWDQRGTLYSKPALMCPEVASADVAAALEGIATTPRTLAAYRTCGERLQAAVGDLSAFNSAENADDVEALRVAMGYDSINFYGVSYGTELGPVPHAPASGASAERGARRGGAALATICSPSRRSPCSGSARSTSTAARPSRAAPPHFPPAAALPRPRRPAQRQDRSRCRSRRSVETPRPGTGEADGIASRGTRCTSRSTADVYRLVPLIVDRADRGDYTYVSTLLLPLELFDTTMALGMNADGVLRRPRGHRSEEGELPGHPAPPRQGELEGRQDGAADLPDVEDRSAAARGAQAAAGATSRPCCSPVTSIRSRRPPTPRR